MLALEAMPDPARFSRRWVDAWNRHDIEGVLGHFHDDVLFTSPVAAGLLPDTGGVIRGKDALRAYWDKAIRLIPDLRFEVEAAHAGVDVLVLRCRNQKGVAANEVLLFRGNKVHEGHGTYPPDHQNLAGVGAH